MIYPESTANSLVIKPLDVKALHELYREVLDLASSLPPDDPVAKQEFLEEELVTKFLNWCWIDTRAYCTIFYEEAFVLGFSSLHDELWAVIDAKNEKGEPKYKKVVVKGARGLGKSTSCRALVSKRMRFLDSMFVVYIGKNEGFAINQSEMIKNSSQLNELENFFWSPLNPKYSDTFNHIDPSFSKKVWTSSQGPTLLPRGTGQPVRGQSITWDQKVHRVELAIMDDIEDPKFIDSEDYRESTYRWVLSDVVEAKPLPGMSTNYQFIYIDTLKHEDSVLQRLIDRGDWTVLDLPICDSNFHSLAPNFVSDKDIEEEVKEHREANPSTIDVFYQEKMGIPISLEDASFQKSMFKYYDERDELEESPQNYKGFKKTKHSPYSQTVVLVDPSKTVKMHSADSGFAVVTVNNEENAIFIRYADGVKVTPDELYDHAFNLAIEYGASVIGYEETSLNEFIRKPFADAMLRRGLNFQLEPLKARRGTGEFAGVGGGKKARIASMIPYYRKGEIYHNHRNCAKLEGQLLSFPKSKLWDVMDVTAYFVFLLEVGKIFWTPADQKYESKKEVEKEYAELYEEDEYEDDIQQTFRMI